MAAASYYQLDSFPNSDPTAGSDLYSGHDYNNHPVHPSEPSRPDLHTVHSNGNSYNCNDDHMRPTEPSRPDLYTLHSNSNSYNSPPQHPMNNMHSSPPPQLSIDSWNARPPHPTDPPTKPLVHSSHVAVPQPLKIQTPNSRLRQRRFQTLKRYLRIGKIVTKVITILFSTVMFAIMLFTVIKYQSTKGEFRGGRTAWPKQPKLWPTFMLLAGAGLTLLLSSITLLSYCCAFDKARRSWKLTVVKYVIHIGAWLVISALYRYEKSTHGVSNDLWGWSCSTEATALQSEFNGVVHFSSLCSVQSKSWEVSLAEVVAKIVFAVGHYVIYRKTRDDEKQHLANGVGGAGTDFLEDVF
ncbi:hypothetical protein HO133_011099 [Letharia lupina]|uniref:Uncharacterized protein n=1 Tax=Letharia lupina TaxID=560253 RepID=A0A8H6CJ90_9LECA|nr:uncharacterized protein HO133_011099 [Letharia lupina]KAF6224522.1 hypothetical protein HO133_011099 [Letharia lupina]